MQDLDFGDQGPDGSEVESTLLQSVRTKCVIQLLLLGALDSFQVSFFNQLHYYCSIHFDIFMADLFGALHFDAFTCSPILTLECVGQKTHWQRLQPSHKRLYMDTLLSMVDFAASYNSDESLRSRMEHVCGDR